MHQKKTANFARSGENKMDKVFTSQRPLEELEFEKAIYVNPIGSRIITIRGEDRNCAEAYERMIKNYRYFLPNARNIRGLENCEFGLCDCKLHRSKGIYVVSGYMFAFNPDLQARGTLPTEPSYSL